MRAPLEPVTEALLVELTDILVRCADPSRVVLFGSRARGDAGSGSDLDILVIEREPFGPGRSRLTEAGRLLKLLARFLVPIDLLVYSEGEVERWRDTKNHVIARALREGRVLHERA